ncbi:hypothetical protein FACS1894211_15060 [Clostridia bacterium]|nr:hypothetical protein FACS1894211_15060 [Clostridia bacterium]
MDKKGIAFVGGKRIENICIRDPFVFTADGGFCLTGTMNRRGIDGWFSRDLKEFGGPYRCNGHSQIDRRISWRFKTAVLFA